MGESRAHVSSSICRQASIVRLKSTGCCTDAYVGGSYLRCGPTSWNPTPRLSPSIQPPTGPESRCPAILPFATFWVLVSFTSNFYTFETTRSVL